MKFKKLHFEGLDGKQLDVYVDLTRVTHMIRTKHRNSMTIIMDERQDYTVLYFTGGGSPVSVTETPEQIMGE